MNAPVPPRTVRADLSPWEHAAAVEAAETLARRTLQATADELTRLTGSRHVITCNTGADTWRIAGYAAPVPPPEGEGDREAVEGATLTLDRPLTSSEKRDLQRAFTESAEAGAARSGGCWWRPEKPEPPVAPAEPTFTPAAEAFVATCRPTPTSDPALTPAEEQLFRYLAALSPGASFTPVGEPQLRTTDALVTKGLARRDEDDAAFLTLTTQGAALAERLGI